MNKNILALILLCFLMGPNAIAGFAEFFGPSPTSSSIGNQPTLDSHDPGNAYYAPALMSFSDRLAVSLTFGHVQTEVEDINNIVIENSTNSSLQNLEVTRGDANTDYSDANMLGVHASLPLAYENAGHIVFNIFTPGTKLAEVNSGDAFLPEYVMHRARYKRTQVYFSYAHPLSEAWSFSLGTILGLQAGADIGTQATLTGEDYGSSGRLKSEVKPTLGTSFSLAHKSKSSQSFFSYQQEMKSNLRSQAVGEISDPVSSLFTIDIDSMIYYDPHILRLGHAQQWGGFKLHVLVEYQIWENYQTPVVRITNRGGVLSPSDDYEKTQIRNIVIPKLGASFALTPGWQFSMGASYRQTPLKGNFSGPGNSVDTDSIMGSVGLLHKRTLFERELEFSTFLQYHHYKSKDVTKTPGQEDGSTGQKIGADGYELGGHSIGAGLGVTLLF